MKKKLVFASMALAVVALSFTSCKKNECIECDGEITWCEEEYKDSELNNTIPWSTYKSSATLSGCKVVDGE